MITADSLLLERDDIDAGLVQQLKSALAEGPEQHQALRRAVERLQETPPPGSDPGKVGLKLGVAQFLLGRAHKAVDYLRDAKTPLGKFYRGMALIETGNFEAALEALEDARSSGYAAAQVLLQKSAALRGLGRYDDAFAILDELDDFSKQSGEYQYQFGACLSAQGREEDAIGHFERAVSADPRHAAALFRLAYESDRAGDDIAAINYYERCLAIPPVRIGTLINLGILYEDTERYDRAARCYEQVLRYHPTHARARMFLLDAQSAFGERMDEEGEKSRGEINRHLETPVTDFELSVRARNCLKKMNIRSLGDLTRISEPDLLNSKNFGETSLQEIKDILASRNLRLGQALEQRPSKKAHTFNPDDYSPQERAILTKPVTELNLSVRARKCMTRLGIQTIGELVQHTENDLLQCKNFGVTSLVEVRNKLAEFQLKLLGD